MADVKIMISIPFLKINIPEHLWPEGYLTDPKIEAMQRALLDKIESLKQAVEDLEIEKVKDGGGEISTEKSATAEVAA